VDNSKRGGKDCPIDGAKNTPNGATASAPNGATASAPKPILTKKIQEKRERAGGAPVDNSKSKPNDSEILAAACVRICAADPRRFATGPTEIIRWQHHAAMALERTESREVAVGVILKTLSHLEKALKERKVSGDWRDYAEAIRKRVRSNTLQQEAEIKNSKNGGIEQAGIAYLRSMLDGLGKDRKRRVETTSGQGEA